MDNDYTRPYDDDATKTHPQFQRQTPPPWNNPHSKNLPNMSHNYQNRYLSPKPQKKKNDSIWPKIFVFIACMSFGIALYVFAIEPLFLSDDNQKETASTIESTQPTEGAPNIAPTTTQSEPAKSSNDQILAQIEANLVPINGGTFQMGATYEQLDYAMDREFPVHEVTVSNFKLSKYEVTQEQWEAVMGSNPSSDRGAKIPVNNVSWNDCKKFISKLNSLTGKSYRLPTEAEWEFVARGGNLGKNYLYSGSDNIDEIAWHKGNSGNKAHAVGQKRPNELGLYDMSGNVFEWCSDGFGNYGSGAQYNPKGSGSTSQHVGRGGGFNLGAKFCRVSGRTPGKSNYKDRSLGLRLAHD